MLISLNNVNKTFLDKKILNNITIHFVTTILYHKTFRRQRKKTQF